VHALLVLGSVVVLGMLGWCREESRSVGGLVLVLGVFGLDLVVGLVLGLGVWSCVGVVLVLGTLGCVVQGCCVGDWRVPVWDAVGLCVDAGFWCVVGYVGYGFVWGVVGWCGSEWYAGLFLGVVWTAAWCVVMLLEGG